MSDHTVSTIGVATMRNSSSPCGLYARQKWLGAEHAPNWKEDFDRTVSALRHGQGRDGLWADSPLTTVRHLFGLHLTVRSPDPGIERALDAMLTYVRRDPSPADDRRLHDEDLFGLPFAPCRWLDTVIPAIMFLGSLFGRSSQKDVLALYERSVRKLSQSPLETARPCWIHNSFRALVVHPEYATHAVTRHIVDWYAQRQTPHGDWGVDIPFYQTLNAMAHLDSAAASEQCQAAINALPSRQNADGSWGKQQREWHTFLALHALRNKGNLTRPSENRPQP